MHSENRKGKKIKTKRRTGNHRNIDRLETLLNAAYTAKVSEGLSEGTLYRYKHVHGLLLQYLDEKELPRKFSSLHTETCRDFAKWILRDRVTTNHFRKRLKIYADRAGIKLNVHPHLFCHSAATMYKETIKNMVF